MDLELRHLRTLCAIADAGSLGRAAALLKYSQPAMSTQLRRIERLFGDDLFVRTASGVEPTQYGLEVLTQARDILARADAIRRRPAGTASKHPGSCALRPPTRPSCPAWSSAYAAGGLISR